MSSLLVQPLELGAHLHAQLGVEVRQRLVEQERLGLAHQRPAHGDALALAAGELRRPAREQLVEPQHGADLRDAPVDLGPGGLALAQPEGEVLVHRHVRVERVVLEDHGDVAVARRQMGDVLAGDRDRPRGRRLEPGDQAQRRGLAAARRPHEDHELAVGDVERQAVDRHGRAGELLGHVLEGHIGHGATPFLPGSLLDPGVGDGLDEPALGEQEDRQHGDLAHHGPGHEQVPLGHVRALEHRQAQLQGRVLGRGDDDQRPEEVVPRPHELDDRQGGQHRRRERQDDLEEDPEARGAVDARRLLELHGQRLEELAQQEDAEDAAEVGHDQAADAVDEPQVPHDEEGRDEHDLEGDHQRDQQQHEEQVAADEAQPREGVGGEAAEEEVAGHGGQRVQEAVEEEVPERQRVPGVHVVGEVQGARG